jgi:hypothetical protein
MLDERPVKDRTGEDTARPTNEVVVRVQSERRRRPSVVGVMALALAGVLVIGGIAVARGWFGLGDLVAPRTIDRSAPVLVERLRNASEYRGATGTFSTTVDIEHTVGIVPRFIAGSRAVYSGVGTVDATVDLRNLVVQAAATGVDGALVVRLPHARLGAVQLDAERSHVMNRDRGILDRVGGVFVDSPTSEQELERVSRRRIASAAAKGELRERAETSTARMIEDLAESTGAGPVEVRFGTR